MTATGKYDGEEFLRDWKPLIEKAAQSVAADFPDVERDEIEGYLTVFVYETEALTSPQQPAFRLILDRAAVKYAWELRKQHLSLSSQYSYRVSDVRDILETVFYYSEWDLTRVPHDGRSWYNHYNDPIELASDIAWALDQLPDAVVATLATRYRDKKMPGTSGEKKALTRALKRLTDALNFYNRRGSYEGPGSRKSMNNATARAKVDSL